jgi:L-alanine-DL-glutamate epimerase-like enolase superfamily enzyme
MTSSPIGCSYEQVAELPVVIDGYTLELLSRRVSTGFRRFTTVFRLTGAEDEGVGEDVTYEAAEHRRAQSAGPVLPLAGTWTLEAFSRHLERLDTFPDRPPMHDVSRTYRRWALESAALDLALRQAGRSLHEVLGRVPAPVRFVVSLNLGPAPSCAPLLSRRAACGALRFKLDATSEWGDGLLECLAASGCVDAIDFKGVYQGTLSATRTDPDLYRRVARALPDVWLEDPDLSDPAARVALHSERDRVTWDAPIHSAADIAAQPWVARTVNIKPSRFGTLRGLLDTYDHCATYGIGVYGGGQYELGPGRGQAQYLAALFHPNAPNDLAPAGFDDPVPPADVPCSPMIVSPAPVGFGAQHEPRARACAQAGSANSRNPAYAPAAAIRERPAPAQAPTQITEKDAS